MCEDASVLTDMTHDELIDKLMENLMVLFVFNYDIVGEQLPSCEFEFDAFSKCEYSKTVISILYQNDIGAGGILQLRQKQGKLKGLHLCRLVLWFLRTPVDSEEADKFQYVATILNNVTRVFCD